VVSEKKKSVLIVRYGALGDMVQATCVFPYWSALGYEITLHCEERGWTVAKHNPHVKYMIPHNRESVPLNELMGYWQGMSVDYDQLCVLTGNVVEGQLLWSSNHFMWAAGERHRRRAASKYNYCDKMIEVAGFNPIPPVRGEVYSSKFEREWAKRLIKKKLRHKYVLVWAHSGSSIHKSYAYYWHVMEALLNKWDDLVVITTGDEWCIALDMEHPRVINTSGLWDFRQAMAVVPYVDCVVGPETGLLNVAGCFSTPKICLLSHSSRENLVKHWENDYSMQAPCDCSPCHRLFRYKDDPDICPKGPLGHQICQEIFPPKDLVKQIERIRETHASRNKNGKAQKKAHI
jgi:ADP-heptose:LPS heptosyltransferase